MPRKLSALLSALCLLMLATAISTPAVAQDQADGDEDVVPAPDPRQSPVAIAATHLEDGTYVRVVYGSPRMRGRTIYGGLVPYGDVWRTGANEATELTVTDDVMFNDQPLDAGTYALFTVPGPESWTIILNSGLGQWGAYEYNEDLDVLRTEVVPEVAPIRHEAFTVTFDEAEGGTDLVLLWDRTRVSVPIRSR